MTYMELLRKAASMRKYNEITLDEFEDMIEPLHRDVLTAPAIPLDQIKQARDEIENLEVQIQSYHNDNPMISQSDVLAILDKLLEHAGG